jgi:hypothetical protein
VVVVDVEVVEKLKTQKLKPPELPIDNVASHHTATATQSLQSHQPHSSKILSPSIGIGKNTPLSSALTHWRWQSLLWHWHFHSLNIPIWHTHLSISIHFTPSSAPYNTLNNLFCHPTLSFWPTIFSHYYQLPVDSQYLVQGT